METTVKLQEPFSYSAVPIILLALVLFFSALVFLLVAHGKKRAGRAPATGGKAPEPSDYMAMLEQKKTKYLGVVAELEKELADGTIQERDCYQGLSLCARRFVSDVTGVELTKMTLTEISRLKMPDVKELITDFYAPEFAHSPRRDVGKAIENTKRMIEKWK